MSDLQSVDVSELLEKKGNLSYLSWAHAWGEALKIDPAATFEVHTFNRGDGVMQPYMDCNGTAFVWVTATMNGKAMTCQLPVMDHKNKPIINPDAFAVNTAMMRCLVKAIALHGLGLYVYKGEDVPSHDDEEKVEKKVEKVEEKKSSTPPTSMSGTNDPWKMKVSMKPNGNVDDWLGVVIDTASIALSVAKSKADVMQIFMTNRAIFDQLNLTNKAKYEELMAKFKAKKESFQ